MERHAWLWAAAASAVISAGYLLLDNEMLRESLWILALVATCTAMHVGARLHRPSRSHPFLILLAAFTLILFSYLVRFPAWHSEAGDLLSGLLHLVAYPMVAIAMLALIRLQAPGGDREGAIDGAIVMIAMATLLAGTVYDLSQLGADSDVLDRLLMIVAPLLLAAVSAASFRLLFVGSVRVPSAWFLVAAAAGGLAGNVARSVLSSQGAYERGTWVDLLLFTPYAFVALACLHPSIAALTEPTEPGARRLTLARLVVLGSALLAAPATLVIQQPGVGVSLPIVSSVVLSLLVLWRLARLVVEREAARRALHERAQRQEALARIGRRALDDPELSSLYDEMTDCCRLLLDLDDCAVLAPGQAAPERAIAVEVDPDAGTLIAVRARSWNDEDLAFLRAAANVLTGAYRRHADRETMHHRAVHDALTGLPNRVLILDRIEQALARARRTDDAVSVLFLDLDGFKQINDVYGHQAGDDVLVRVAARLRDEVREADTVGRLSGDEFVVVCDGAAEAVAIAVADRIVATLPEPFDIDAGTVRVGISIGLVSSTVGSDDAERLLSEADLAMYHAKAQLGSSVVVFDQDVGAASERRRRLELDLTTAIANEALHLVYQPLVRMDPDGAERVVGVEALLRWDHPERGPIPPLEFIPVAESAGLMQPLGDWIITTAIAQLARWTSSMSDDLPFTLWVNLSPRQLSDGRLPEHIAHALAASGVAPSRFGCEITESAILSEDAIPVIASLRDLGVQLALDDFGTGFSSLSHLKQVAMDLVKIDRSFVAGVADGDGDGDRAIIRAVTSLARDLGVEVVGEGVETSEQLQALHELGCDVVQGYLLGRPVPADQIVAPVPPVAGAASSPVPSVSGR